MENSKLADCLLGLLGLATMIGLGALMVFFGRKIFSGFVGDSDENEDSSLNA